MVFQLEPLTVLDWAFRIASILFAAGTFVAVWYRFRWGSKSRVSFRQMPDPRKRGWSRSGNQDTERWSTYIHLLGTNRGWWSGVIWTAELEKVVFDKTNEMHSIAKEVDDLIIETYTDGEEQRLDLDDPHQREERDIPARDNSHLKIVPFIKAGGEFEKRANSPAEAEFIFKITIQDNRDSSVVTVPVAQNLDGIDSDR
jgi:hypothetical protein